MKNFRKIWDEEKNEFIKTTKGMKNKEAYTLFLQTFPEVTDVTQTAFVNQRSRLGAAGPSKNPHFTRAPRPLYSEHVKKGIVQIKIGQPNVWISKARWIYEQAHPEEDYTDRANYIFLDGNNRNFNVENIARIPLKLIGVFNGMGGTIPGNPEATKIRIAQAKLKMMCLDIGEKIGDVKYVGNSRRFISDINESARKQRIKISADLEKMEIIKRKRKEYYQRKRKDVKWVEKRKEYQKEHYRKKRQAAKK